MYTWRTHFFRRLRAGLALSVGMIFLSVNASWVYAFNDNSPIVTGWSDAGTLEFPFWDPNSPDIIWVYQLKTTFAPDGTPYAIFADMDNSNQLSVMKYSNGAWGVVGGFHISNADVSNTAIAVAPDGTPYIVYNDGNSGDWGLVVKKFSWGTWNLVAGPQLSIPTYDELSIAIAPDGTPYIMYGDMAYPNALADGYYSTVIKYSGGAWSVVGAEGAIKGLRAKIIVASDGTPYASYFDHDNSDLASVAKYSGGAWSVIGAPGFISGSSMHPALTTAPDGTPYIAFIDGDYANRLTVMKYTSGAWSIVGDPGFSTMSSWNAIATTVAPDGTPYVVYRDADYNSQATVMKYTSGVWSIVGNSGFIKDGVDIVALGSMFVDSSGTPYISYTNDSFRGIVVVMKHAIPTVGTVQSVVPKNLIFRKANLSNSAQDITSSGGIFKIADTKGSAAGYYATLSASDLTDTNGNTIPSANIYATTIGSTMRTFSWSTNASVVSPSAGGSVGAGWVSLNNPTTIIERNNDGGGIFGTYGINPIIRVTIPPYTPVGSYRGSFTFTLIEN